jgi:uncharacterized protein (DUF2141 family)
MSVSRLVALVSWLIPIATAAGAQTPVRDAGRTLAAPPATGTVVLAGIVMTDDVESRPIRRATVMIGNNPNMSGGRLTVTDDEGRFRFAGLPAGRYVVTATKPGYVPAAYGTRRPMRTGEPQTGTAIAVEDGQQVTDLILRILRGAVITGTIRGIDGQPARGISVGLLQWRPAPPAGVRILTAVRTANVDSVTDARGVYRIFGLPPGEYFVAAFPPSAANLEQTRDVDLLRALEPSRTRPGIAAAGMPAGVATASALPRPAVGFAPMFYPGTSSRAGAAPIALRASEVRGGVDIQLQLVPNSRVEGTVHAPDGRPAAGASMWLYALAGPAEQQLRVDWGFMGAVTTDAAGVFSIKGVPPGSYVLRATTRPAGPNEAAFWGFADVAVQSDDVRVTVALEPGIRVAGRLIFDGATTPSPQAMSRVRIGLLADQARFATVNLPYATIDSSGEFSFASVPPGRYRLTASIPGAGQDTWALESAQLNGQDALDGTAEVPPASDVATAVVRFTDRTTELSGQMVDAMLRPAPEYFLIVFPMDRAAWTWQSRRIQQTRPSHDGRFVFRHLPPGDYLLAAVTDVERDEWFDPAFLETLIGSAIEITLAEGEKRTQDIRVR